VQASVSSDETPTEQSHQSTGKSLVEQLQSSSSAFRTPRDSVDGEFTVRGVGRPKTLDWDKLRYRQVNEKPSEDGQMQSLKDLLNWKRPKLTAKQVKEVQAIFRDFAQLNDKEVDYPEIESVSNNFDKWKAKVSLARITQEHFSGDITTCAFSNEAVLQRTIMMEIIDRHQLHKWLTFNSEGQWYQKPSDCLVSTNGDLVTGPKPDLNISFRLESFNKWAPVPSNLISSFRPDSTGKKEARCFPFLFFEVKKANDTLEAALLANLHSASQALLNIYAWMFRAQQAQEFFQQVRIFTFVFNARNLTVRMHRATPQDITILHYHFVEFAEFTEYTKDEVCVLLRRILEKYAIEKLHPLLKSAFDTITGEHGKSVQERQRRSAAFARESAANRARSRASSTFAVNESTLRWVDSQM
jgi:hypothetical protein